MKSNPEALVLHPIQPGRVAWIYNAYFLAIALELCLLAAGYHYVAGPPIMYGIWWTMLPLTIWAMFMGVPHKKAGTLLLSPQHLVIHTNKHGKQTFPIAALPTIYWYIDGAAADMPEYTETIPARGSGDTRERTYFWEARTGLKKPAGVQHRRQPATPLPRDAPGPAHGPAFRHIVRMAGTGICPESGRPQRALTVDQP